jgi:hypothetical protein
MAAGRLRFTTLRIDEADAMWLLSASRGKAAGSVRRSITCSFCVASVLLEVASEHWSGLDLRRWMMEFAVARSHIDALYLT